ncbi:MAG: rubredoxin, partial [Methanomassiliicoccaceae archaeon]|nr:rubredoxin [Methanomassiliicoccaceae archaeon]
MNKYRCSVCGHIYDEAVGMPEAGIPPGTKWKDLPKNWVCPVCGAPKSAFVLIEDKSSAPAAALSEDEEHEENLRELTPAEVSAICSSLAIGCDKQSLDAERDAFNKIAEYYKRKVASESGKTLK